MYKRLVEEKMWRKIAKLDTKLDIFLQCNKAITLTVIFSVKQKSFLSLQEKKKICIVTRETRVRGHPLLSSCLAHKR